MISDAFDHFFHFRKTKRALSIAETMSWCAYFKRRAPETASLQLSALRSCLKHPLRVQIFQVTMLECMGCSLFKNGLRCRLSVNDTIHPGILVEAAFAHV